MPNIVFILIDDLGWMDTSEQGSSFYETPHIDRLMREGVTFSQFYASGSVCSPTRAALMTGKHPARLHLTNWIGGEQIGPFLQAEYIRQLPLEEVTFAEAFREAGYKTGFIGKWHLGTDPFHPRYQGFDTTLAAHHAGQPGSYFYPYKHPNNSRLDVPDLASGSEGEYLTDRLTDEAVRFIEARQTDPFLLVLSHYAVHTPLQAKQDLIEKYKSKAPPVSEGPNLEDEGTTGRTRLNQDNPVYAGMIESTDQSIGRILDTLAELNLDEHTIVVFTSDNGGLSTLALNRTQPAPTSNQPLRAGKGWLYEGGIRVPTFIKWPGVVRPGTTTDLPAVTTDFYPTLLEMAGLPPRPHQHQDGISLVSHMRTDSQPGRSALFWHFPHYHGSGNVPSSAVRSGDYKLIEWLETGEVELYDLSTDLSERTDLSPDMPEKTSELLQSLHAWRQTVDAQMPRPNPNWVSSE